MKTSFVTVTALAVIFISRVSFGQQWTRLQSPFPQTLDFKAFQGDAHPLLGASGSTLYVGTDSGLSVSSDAGLTWTNKGFSYPIQAVMRANNSLLVLAGAIYRSTDEGVTWLRNNNVGASGGAGYLLQFGSRVYLTDNGGFFRSSDDGETWKITSTAGHEFIVMTEDANYLLASDVYSGGKSIYRSADSGVTWVQVSTLPSWCLALLETGSVVIAGTEDRLYISSDHGEHWTPSRNGMPPKTQVNDLKRVNGRIIASTTNGVFVSSDLGNSWNWVSNGFADEPNVQEVIVAGTYVYAFARIPEAALYRMPLSDLLNVADVRSSAAKQDVKGVIYPNPASAFATISNSSHVIICTMLGEPCAVREEKSGADITLDVSSLPAGVYYVRTDDGRVQKLVKQ